MLKRKYRVTMDFEVLVPEREPNPDSHQDLDPISALEAAMDPIGHEMMLLSDHPQERYGCIVLTDGVISTRQTFPPVE